jgi:hypothetical protein
VTPQSYAAQVVQVLREHFPDLGDPVTAEIIADQIERQIQSPQDWFEVIVDTPCLARWRLKARSDDRRRVRLHCYRALPSTAESSLEATMNDALRALGAES